MEQAKTGELVLEYEVSGTGEPVVLIHGALIADMFRPLLAEPSLAGRYRLILYHRRGYAGSSRASGPVTVPQQAADCLALLRHLDIERTHVVGQSYGGVIALQLALAAPDMVGSLALLEPALMVGAEGQGYRESLAKGVDRYRQVGSAAVVEEFLEARSPGYRAVLERQLPRGFAQAVADAGTSFESELPGLLDWRFGQEEAGSISQPTLSVLGERSDALWPRFGETHRLLLEWLPDVHEFILPGAAHLLQLENPRGMAEALGAFWARHRLVDATT